VVGGPNFGRLERKPSTLFTLWTCRGFLLGRANTIGAGWFGALILLAQGGSVRQYTVLAHRCPPPPIGNDDQARCANNFFSCSVHHYYWRRVRRCANSIGGL
jgi:hypothetical protein